MIERATRSSAWVLAFVGLGCSGGTDGTSGGPNLSSGSTTDDGTDTLSTSSISATAASTSAGTESASATNSTSSTGPMGTGPSSATDPSGTSGGEDTGEASCANWVTELARLSGTGREAREFGLGPDGTLLGVGFTQEGAWAFALDRCDGTLLEEFELGEALTGRTTVGDIVIDGDQLYVTGRLYKDDTGTVIQTHVTNLSYSRDGGFATEFAEELSSDETQHETFDLALGGGGDLWIVGSVLSTDPDQAVVIKGTATGSFCTFGSATSQPGRLGRAGAARGDELFAFAGDAGATMAAARYTGSTCTCNGCAPVSTATSYQIDDLATSPQTAETIGGDIYVAGYLDGITSARAFLTRVDDVSLEPAVVTTRTASRGGAAYQQLAATGGELYAAGANGITDPGQLDAADVTVDVYALPLGDGDLPVRTFTTPQLGLAQGMAVEEAGGGILLAGGKSGDTFVMRCDQQDGCE